MRGKPECVGSENTQGLDTNSEQNQPGHRQNHPAAPTSCCGPHVTGKTKEPSGFSFSRFPPPAVHWRLIKPCKDPDSWFHTTRPTNTSSVSWICPPQLPAGSHVESGKFHAFPSLYFTRKTLIFSSATFVSYLWILWQLLFPSAIQSCKRFQIISTMSAIKKT